MKINVIDDEMRVFFIVDKSMSECMAVSTQIELTKEEFSQITIAYNLFDKAQDLLRAKFKAVKK